MSCGGVTVSDRKVFWNLLRKIAFNGSEDFSKLMNYICLVSQCYSTVSLRRFRPVGDLHLKMRTLLFGRFFILFYFFGGGG